MNKSHIVRIVLWILWTISTVVMVFLWKVPEGIKRMFNSIALWITSNPVAFVTIIWGLFTVAIFLDLALKFDRESPAKTKTKSKTNEE